jgi:hypothetical protein
MTLVEAVQQDPWASALVLIVMALVPPATALIRLRLGLPDAGGTGRHRRPDGGEGHMEELRG